MQSALEKEILHATLKLRAWLGRHDRMVVLGVLLALPPIPPIPFVAVLLALLHYRLWRQHKLPPDEIRLIRISLGVALVSSGLAVGLLLYVLQQVNASSGEVLGALQQLWQYIETHWQALVQGSQRHKDMVAL
jgi:hypothetical protein